MIGIVVVTQGHLGQEMVRTLYSVLGPVPGLEAVSNTDEPEVVKEEILRTVERADEGDGVFVLTDMLGNTATNLSLTVARTARAEVVAGVNMPMLVKAVSARRTMGLRELAAFIREYGREHIFWASERNRSADGAAR